MALSIGLGGCPSYGDSDHLDLFLTALRHRGAGALLLLALTCPAFSADLIGRASTEPAADS